MIASVFDVDRTLLPGTTAERVFVRFLLRRRILPIRSGLESIRFLALYGRSHPIRAFRAHRPYLAGLSTATMIEAGLRCFEDEIRPRLSLAGVEALRGHAARGHRTVLLSGSLPFLIDPLAAWLKADHVIASRMETAGQLLTGRMLGIHPHGAAKAVLVRRYARRAAIDLGRSYCYADHHSDAGMLRLFGHPVCINPTARLRALADRLGWPVGEFA